MVVNLLTPTFYPNPPHPNLWAANKTQKFHFKFQIQSPFSFSFSLSLKDLDLLFLPSLSLSFKFPLDLQVLPFSGSRDVDGGVTEEVRNRTTLVEPLKIDDDGGG
ncbi:hypothetical protein HanIR_Chr15g0740611 [Helianthus annuus]|nr:hypothetical protein HanIR_Chr15g0740611 [Helianthus annuus]